MLHLRVLGALDLTGAERRDKPTDGLLAQPKRVALLVYLVAGAPEGCFHRRDALLALFWPELDDARARRALNQALYFLRAYLGAGVVIARGDDEVGVDLSRMTCDVVQLRAAVAAQRHDEALALYQGELLPGFHADVSNEFRDWLDAQRRTLVDAVTQSACALSAQLEREGNLRAAIPWARRAREISPLDEACVQQLIGLLMRAGDAAGAHAEYARFAERLRSALDVDPGEATRSLLDAPGRTRASAVTTDVFVADSPSPLPQQVTPRQPQRRSTRTRVGAAAGLALVVMGTVALWGRLPGTLSLARSAGQRPTILVADFTGPSSDSALGGVATLLAVSALQESRAARAVWSGEVASALQRMTVRPGTAVRDTVAREVAVREGYGAVLEGFVRDSRRALLVGISLVEPQTNHVMFTKTASAPTAGELTRVIDDLMRATRRRLGDDRSTIAGTPPLPQVTTSSLDGLRAFSASLHRPYAERRARIALLERAIELDTAFASAYRRLGVELYWDGQRERSSDALRKALDHVDRLSATERDIVKATLYAKGRFYDPVRALAAFDAILARDSTDAIAIDNKIWLLMELRQYDRAARLLSTNKASIGYGLFARASFLAGRPKDAWRALQEGIREPEIFMERARSFLLAGELDSAEANVARGLERSSEADRRANEVSAADIRASMARRRGRLAEAHLHDAERLRIAKREGRARAVSLVLARRLREAAWLLGRPDLVRQGIPELRRRLDSTQGSDRPVPSLAITYADAGDPWTAAALLRDFEKTIAPGEWREIVALIHVGWAHVALAEGRANDAVRELRRADIGVCSICVLPMLSIAYERAGQPDSAIATGERYLSTIDVGASTYDGHYRARLEHRLGRLYLRRNDGVRAAQHLAAFIGMWSDADPELRPQVDSARRELLDAQRIAAAGRATSGRVPPPADGHHFDSH